MSGEICGIKFFNVEGLFFKIIKIRLEYWFRDIVVDSNGDFLYCDWEIGIVYKVKNGCLEELIRLLGWRLS